MNVSKKSTVKVIRMVVVFGVEMEGGLEISCPGKILIYTTPHV